MVFTCTMYFWILAFQTYGKHQEIYEEIDVQLYQIQVNVADPAGTPIRGLTLNDFSLKLDGQEQVLESVYEVTAPDAESTTPTALEPAALPQMARRNFVMVFDLSFVTLKGLILARRAARDFVQNQMRPTDLVSIFALSSETLNMVNNFTNDKDQLLWGIDTLGMADDPDEVRSSSGYLWRRHAVDSISRVSIGNFGSSMSGPEEANFLEGVMDGTRRFNSRYLALLSSHYLANFKRLAEGLKVIKGRKNLVLFSHGIKDFLLTGNINMGLEDFALSGQYSFLDPERYGMSWLRSSMQDSIDELQESGTLVFSINTGLLIEPYSNYDLGENFDKQQNHNVDGLHNISHSTGGKAYLNFNRLEEPMELVEKATANYYVLSFYLSEPLKNMDFAKVNVNVKRPEAKITAQKKLAITPDFTQSGDLEKLLMLANFLGWDYIDKTLPLQVGLCSIPGGDSETRFCIMTALLPKPGEAPVDPDNIEIYTLAIEKGTERLVHQRGYAPSSKIKKDGRASQETGFHYFTDLSLPAGNYKLKVFARNRISGETGSEILDLSVSDRAPMLGGPIWVKNPAAPIVNDFRTNRTFDEPGVSQYPFVFSNLGLVPDLEADLSPQHPAALLYLLDGQWLRDPNATPEITAAIIGSGGEVIPMNSRSFYPKLDVGEDGGPRFLMTLDFKSLGLEAGAEYTLLTKLSQPGSNPILAKSRFRWRP